MTTRLVSASVHEKVEKSSMKSDGTKRKKKKRKPLKHADTIVVQSEKSY